MKIPTRRHAITILYLLRGYADQQRRMHGKLVERPGGIELTPTEMETWANDVEAACKDLLGSPASLAGPVHTPAPPARKVIIQPNTKRKRGRST